MIALWVGVWKWFFENFRFCIDCNFGAMGPFLIVLGLFESLDIDLCNGTGPIKKYFLSSEIQLPKVGRIPEISWKSRGPGQHSLSGAHKGVRSHSFTDIESAEVKLHFFVPRDIGAEYELGLRIWSAWPYVQNSWPKKMIFEKKYFWCVIQWVFHQRCYCEIHQNQPKLGYRTKWHQKVCIFWGNQISKT